MSKISRMIIDWLGNKYTEHSDGTRSEEKTDWLGNKYTERS